MIETLENNAGARLDAVRLYWLDGEVYADPRAIKLQLALMRLAGRHPRGGVFIVAAPASEAETPPDLTAFLSSLEPLSAWLARIDARYKA